MPRSLLDIMEHREDITAGRHGGNAESAAAHGRIKADLPRARAEVLELIRRAGMEGMTVKEIAAGMGKSVNAVSGRRTELLASGDIVDSGRRRDGCAVVVARDVMYGQR